jgi:16S rRNA (uracil1498-N3)-methyltransferase
VVERDDRPAVATFFVDATLTPAAQLPLSDAAAHHARVKRLEIGDAIRLTDGQGTIARGALAVLRKNVAEVLIKDLESIDRPPSIHIRVPISDRERMLWLAEKVTELGVATWQGVRFRRSMSVSPRGDGPAFAEKLRARMISALEQSGGAWLPQIVPDAEIDSIDVPANADRILLDATGRPLLLDGRLSPDVEPVIVFGPEGGVEPDERAALIAAGWRLAKLAATTLRFETAGIAAVAVIRTAQLSEER